MPVGGAARAIVECNPQFAEWHTKSLNRLPGLKWMRTLWVAH